jgi:hypothetical protein
MTKVTKHLTLTAMLTIFIELSGCASSGELCLSGTKAYSVRKWEAKSISAAFKGAETATNECLDLMFEEAEQCVNNFCNDNTRAYPIDNIGNTVTGLPRGTIITGVQIDEICTSSDDKYLIKGICDSYARRPQASGCMESKGFELVAAEEISCKSFWRGF